jgi:hypothetical protein
MASAQWRHLLHRETLFEHRGDDVSSVGGRWHVSGIADRTSSVQLTPKGASGPRLVTYLL